MSASNVCSGCNKSITKRSGGGCRTGGNCKTKGLTKGLTKGQSKGQNKLQNDYDDTKVTLRTCKTHKRKNLKSYQVCPECNCVKCGEKLTAKHDKKTCHEDKKCDIRICKNKEGHTNSMCKHLWICNDCGRKHHTAIPCDYYCTKCESSLHLVADCEAVACGHCGSYRHTVDNCKVPECKICDDGAHHNVRDCPNAECDYCSEHDVDNAVGHVAYDARETGCPYILDNPNIDDETKDKAREWRKPVTSAAKSVPKSASKSVPSSTSGPTSTYSTTIKLDQSTKMLADALHMAESESTHIVDRIAALEKQSGLMEVDMKRCSTRIEQIEKEKEALEKRNASTLEYMQNNIKKLAELKQLQATTADRMVTLRGLLAPQETTSITSHTDTMGATVAV